MAQSYSCPPDVETRRLAELRRHDLLDTPHEAEFDALVTIACRLFGVSVSTVTLVDEHRQWFKARAGIEGEYCPRDRPLCATAIYEPEILVVEDLLCDPRFADHPIVTGGPRLRFYAGVPLRPSDPSLPGIGTLCIMDERPRTLSPDDRTQLRSLATMVCAIIRARAAATASLTLSNEVREASDLIHRQNAQLSQAERIVGVGSWRYDLRDGTLDWSDHVFSIYGLPPGPAPDFATAMSAYPPDGQVELARLIERSSVEGEPFDFESAFDALDGTRKCVRAMGEPQRVDGAIVALVGVFQDITEGHERERRLRHSAGTDVLTGLPNRRAFETHLAEAFAAARCGDAPLALLLLDLDGFKAVNDTLGHDAGDEVLRTVAGQLRDGTLGYCFAARLGGDEFVVLLTRPRDCAAAEAVIRTVIETVGTSVAREGVRARVGVTVGAAILDERIDSPQELLRRADVALYAGKRDRRGTGRIDGVPGVIHAERPRPRLVSVG